MSRERADLPTSVSSRNAGFSGRCRTCVFFDVVLYSGCDIQLFQQWVCRSRLFAVRSALAVSLITLAVGLFLNWPFAWWLAIVTHFVLAILVVLAYACLMYILIEDMQTPALERGRFSIGASPIVLAVVTMIFIVVQTLATIPLVILIRNRPDSRIASPNDSHEV